MSTTEMVPAPGPLSDEEKSSLEAEGTQFLERVNELQVASNEKFVEAGTWTLKIVRLRKVIAEKLDPLIKTAHATHAGLCALKNSLDRPLEAAEKGLSRKLSDWNTQQLRLKREAEARERLRLEEEAAKLRKQQEEQARMAREREQARLKKEQEDRFLAEAVKREAEGDHETAELILEAGAEMPAPEPEFIPPPPPARLAPVIMAPPTPKLEGISFREEWKWAFDCGHAEQLDADCENCNVVPRQYLMLRPPAINGVVKALKDKAQIPGIRVWSEQGTSKARR